jgi:predicted ATPase/DNA-binding CsgD family transcriptional regulator
MLNHALPTTLTPFVGRAEELAEIAALLADPLCRLLTLVGPGGIGKTRLAQEAGRLQQGAFANGVYFVPLQPLTFPDFIAPAIADLFKFSYLSDDDPTRHLLNYLHEKCMMLVLDNFEHLVAGADLLSEILNNAAGVKLLITSRERLKLREEWVLDVAGLPFPNNEQLTGREQYSAFQLFVQSARRAGYNPVDTDGPAIARICQLVEGIPLAIELAAAWARVLPCAEIAHEIARSQDILTTTMRNMPEKHRSMRAAFEYSWKLLSEAEQTVFGKLAIFRGGFRREGAEQVAGASLTMLASLFDKSLLRMDSTGRYSLQELLRQYAEEQLNASSAGEATRDAHSAYYAGLLCRLNADLKGPNQVRALDTIESEMDNVRVGWRWAVAQGKADEIVQSLDTLGRFYQMRSRYQEALEAFELASNRFRGEENELLAQLLLWYGSFLNNPKVLDCIQRATTILRPRGAYLMVVMPWRRLLAAESMSEFGGPEAVQQFFQRQLITARETDDAWATAWILLCLGDFSSYAAKYAEAQSFLHESLASFQALGDGWGASIPIGSLGGVAQQLGNYQEALYYYGEKLALCKEVGDIGGMAFALAKMGVVLEGMEQPEALKRYLGEALKLSLDLRFEWVTWMGLSWAAEHLVTAEGQAVQAVELLTCLRKQFGHWSSKRAWIESYLDTLKANLPPEMFATAARKGEISSLDAIAATLLEQFLVPDNQAPSTSTQPLLDPLTQRELEVLHLIAEGMPNDQIAANLVLAVGTVKFYASQIYSKLQVQNRIQATARARELNLLS